MNIINTITIGEIIQTLALLIAIAGILLSLYINRRNERLKVLEMMNSFNKDFYLHDKVSDLYYSIEYSYRKENEKKDEVNPRYQESSEERYLDYILSYFNYLAKVASQNKITAKELDAVGYEMWTIFTNPSVKEYFKDLDAWTEEQYHTKLFNDFRKLCEEKLAPMYGGKV